MHCKHFYAIQCRLNSYLKTGIAPPPNYTNTKLYFYKIYQFSKVQRWKIIFNKIYQISICKTMTWFANPWLIPPAGITYFSNDSFWDVTFCTIYWSGVTSAKFWLLFASWNGSNKKVLLLLLFGNQIEACLFFKLTSFHVFFLVEYFISQNIINGWIWLRQYITLIYNNYFWCIVNYRRIIIIIQTRLWFVYIVDFFPGCRIERFQTLCMRNLWCW